MRIIKYWLVLFVIFSSTLLGICAFNDIDSHHNDILLMSASWAVVFTIRRFTVFKGLK